MDAYTIGVLVGALVFGLVIGSIPAIYGIKKGKKGLAIGGFFTCLILGFLFGALPALVVCGIFLFVIKYKF